MLGQREKGGEWAERKRGPGKGRGVFLFILKTLSLFILKLFWKLILNH
jgi:hypothetical protein